MEDGGRADRRSWLAFAGLIIFGGANAVAVRQSVLELAPLWAAGFRFAIAAALMTTIALAGRQPLPTLQGLRGGATYGLFGFGISFACINVGLRDVPGGTGSVIVATAPLLTLGLAIAQGQERFRVRALVGAIVAMTGVAIVFVDQLETAVPFGSLVLVLVGAASISQSSIVIRNMARNDPLWTNAIGMAVGAALLLLLSAATREPWLLPARETTWIAMGYLVVFGSVVAFSLNVYALRRLQASVVAYAVLLFPLVGLTVATLLTGERFSLSFVAGGAVMLLGVYIGAFRRSATMPTAS
ncbi:MAG TPA: EamA family transporter [Candidatus Limnocylindrales bacterium]|nr:EamA family transporter [Candidatus Limnocylindrales bacterium]